MISQSSYTHLLKLAAIGTAVFCVAGGSFWAGFFDSWQSAVSDRMFLEQEAPSDIVIVGIDNASLQNVGQWPWPRRTLADLVTSLDAADTIGLDITIAEPSRLGQTDDTALATALKQSNTRIVLPITLKDDRVVTRPAAVFSDVGERGFINTTIDADGVIRRAPLRRDDHVSFGAAVTDVRAADLPSSARIEYTGPAGSYTTFSAVDVLNERVPERVFRDATVLIGSTARDLQDFVITPFGEMPGVEYHANVVHAIQERAFLSKVGSPVALMLMAFIIAAAALIVYSVQRILPLMVLFCSLILAIFVGSFIAFSFDVIVPSLYLSFGAVLMAGGGVAYQYVSESQQKQFIRQTFQYYLAPEAIDDLLEHPAKLQLGGDRSELTILFSDIRGFTSLSEQLAPEDLTAILNRYLTSMTDVIMQRRGVVDKFIGDAIMAFWGAPNENPRHAEDACRAVVGMAQRLNGLNVYLQGQGYPALGIGIGLNTGNVVVGNMGSEKRFDYTVMGDEVNFASRLEGLTKQYGVLCLVSDTTHAAVADVPDLRFRKLDRVVVKGKAEPRRIYQLITDETDQIDREREQRFDEGRDAYERGDWTQAIEIFDEILAIHDDGPAKLLRDRCALLLADPPEQWDGVFTFSEK